MTTTRNYGTTAACTRCGLDVQYVGTQGSDAGDGALMAAGWCDRGGNYRCPDRRPHDTLTPDEEFMWAHSGYSYDPTTETLDHGQSTTARELAAAEAEGIARGWEIQWEIDSDPIRWEIDPDPEGDGPPADRDQWVATLVDSEGEYLESLGGIDFGPEGHPATDPYARVVRAQLTLDALAGLPDEELPDLSTCAASTCQECGYDIYWLEGEWVIVDTDGATYAMCDDNGDHPYREHVPTPAIPVTMLDQCPACGLRHCHACGRNLAHIPMGVMRWAAAPASSVLLERLPGLLCVACDDGGRGGNYADQGPACPLITVTYANEVS
jgi:hypothetical protein